MMKHFITRQFSKHLPGPYSVRASSDGVDNTFEVFCLSTNNAIVAAHYWDERDHAFLIARTISAALNEHLHGIMFELGGDTLAIFQEAYPGPFRALKETHEFLGAIFCIDCVTTERGLIEIDGYLSKPSDRFIAKQIVFALNNTVAS